MKDIPYEGYQGLRLPKEIQKKRLQYAMEQGLTELQRETLLAYYVQQLNIVQIAALRGVNKSTVCRTLRRAEKKLRQLLRY